jgi:AcrR family transcriptional regulator
MSPVPEKMPLPEAVEMILDAAIRLYAAGGVRAVSFREVASGAGVSASAVQHYYPDRGQLLSATLGKARQADEQALAALLGLVAKAHPAGDGEAIDAIFRLVLDHALGKHREITAVWLAVLAGAARQRDSEIAWGWIEGRADFWRRLAACAGLGYSIADLLFAYSTMAECACIGFSDQPETALYLDDVIRFGAARFARVPGKPPGNPAGGGRWFGTVNAARSSALPAVARAATPNAAIERILDATADILLEEGPAALTFRAIAARAKVSLSSMTYHFDASTDLLRRGIERVGSRLAMGVKAPAGNSASQDWMGWNDLFWSSNEGACALAGLLELNLIAPQDESLRATVWALTTKQTCAPFAASRGSSEGAVFEAHVRQLLVQNISLLNHCRYGESSSHLADRIGQADRVLGVT